MADIANGEKSHLPRPPMNNWNQLTPSIYHRLTLGSAYGLTDVGLVRKSNEDNFLIDSALGLVAVADGMGGHGGGEIASAAALVAVRESLVGALRDRAEGRARLPHARDCHDPDATLQDEQMPAMMAIHDAVEFANAQVYARNVGNASTDGAGMGTTLTGFWQDQPGAPLIAFHVGDSRLYQQALEEGQADSLPPRNLLLQAIGPESTVVPEVKVCDAEDGDLFMLCSDGLYGNPPHSAIAAAMLGVDAQSLDQCCARLIALAKTYESRDNITCVLALVQR
jgi:PPM family protein phosphatase